MLKQQIEQDLKAALLGGDKERAMVLRGLKSVILYAEVAEGKRETGLSDEVVQALLIKEAKKRQESADLYSQAGDEKRANAELSEKAIIDAYLPKQMADEQLRQLIDAIAIELGASSMQEMGPVISAVKEQSKGAADGGRIARFVKERLQG